jgi:hypothetical protein
VAGWRVHDVVAHLVAIGEATPASFIASLVRSRFRGAVVAEREMRRVAEASPSGPGAGSGGPGAGSRALKAAGPPWGAQRRVAGLSLRATDVNWCFGRGPEVSGKLVSLLLAVTGRHAAWGDLGGPGLSLLVDRG